MLISVLLVLCALLVLCVLLGWTRGYNIHQWADFVGGGLDAVSNSFFGCFSECSLGVTRRLAFFDVSWFLRLRSKLCSSFLNFWGFEANFLWFSSSSEASKQAFFEFSRVLRLRSKLSSSCSRVMRLRNWPEVADPRYCHRFEALRLWYYIIDNI